MKQKRDLSEQWNKIPAARRHFYFLSLVFLIAVIGNRIYSGEIAEDDVEIKKAASEASHIKNVSDSMLTLVR